MYNEQQSSIDKENDQFRITEKKIKKYIKKQLIKNQYQSKRQKRRNESEQMNSFDEKYGSFDWYNVVDIREIKNDNSRYTFTLIQSITNSKLSNSSTVYYVNNTPNGLYFIENALSIDQQLHWSKKALEEYSKAEHTNLTNLYKINNSNSNSKQQTDEMTIDNHEKCVDGLDLHTIENLWQISKDEPNRFQSFSKLRWSCLGYHYDWTERSYQKNLKSLFPEELSSICSDLAESVGDSIVSEAAIVNYYPTGTCMGGHLDDAEHIMDVPIVSMSFGCAALFLIGGREKDVEPIPILVRSGDAIVMSGESRYCYHGIATILPNDFTASDDKSNIIFQNEVPPIFQMYESCDSETKAVLDYLENARINMNVRQVRRSNEEPWIDKCGTGAMRN